MPKFTEHSHKAWRTFSQVVCRQRWSSPTELIGDSSTSKLDAFFGRAKRTTAEVEVSLKMVRDRELALKEEATSNAVNRLAGCPKGSVDGKS